MSISQGRKHRPRQNAPRSPQEIPQVGVLHQIDAQKRLDDVQKAVSFVERRSPCTLALVRGSVAASSRQLLERILP